MTNIYVVTVHVLFEGLPDHIIMRIEAENAEQAEDIARQRAREDNYIFLSAFARKEERTDEQEDREAEQAKSNEEADAETDRRAEQAGESVGAV